jgi:hypothetical protein
VSAVRRLHIPADVRAAIGDDVAERLAAGPWPAGYRCPTCRQQTALDDGPDTTVGLDVYPDGTRRLWLQHRRCGPGGVVHQARGGPAFAQLDDTVTIVAAVEPGASGGPWPFLLVELAAVAIARQGDDGVDLAVGAAAGNGMQPVDSFEHPPPAIAGWRLLLPHRDHPGAVLDPDGGEFLQPLPELAGDWTASARACGGRCGVYLTSQVGLQQLLDAADPDQLLQAGPRCRPGRPARRGDR